MYKKVTGRAPINIALIKYWGKKDAVEVIPFQPSISLSLDIYETITTIETHQKQAFEFELNGSPHEKTKMLAHTFLKQFTDEKTLQGIKVSTHNSGPTAAGLASSASGFAALAVTANRFFETHFSLDTLAKITRKGSGSAIRSLLPDCVMWRADGGIEEVSFPFEDVCMGIIIINGKEKKIGSTQAMKISVETSPIYANWVRQSFIDTDAFLQALKDKDFNRMGEISEQNALHMHLVALLSVPKIEYLEEASREVIKKIQMLRQRDNIKLYATMDAGPNVKILTNMTHQQDISVYFKSIGYDVMWSKIDKRGACILDEVIIN